MVSITENAAVELKKIMEEKEMSEHGLRIFAAGEGCCGPEYGIGLEENLQDSDKVFESHEIKIFVTEGLAATLDGSVVDYVKTPYGSGFVINRPGASTCGDGSCNSCH